MEWSAAYRDAEVARACDAARSLAVAAGRGDLDEDYARDLVVDIARVFVSYTPAFPVVARSADEAKQAFQAATVRFQNLLLHLFGLAFEDADLNGRVAENRVRRAVVPMLEAQRPRADIELTARRIAGDSLGDRALASVLEEEVGWWVRRRRAAARRRG